MHIDELKATEGRDLELETLKKTLRRTVSVSKAVWEYRETLESLKDFISSSDHEYASGLWNDLDYQTQKLLFTAPTKGGAFTTNEREIVRGFWIITEQDMSPT